MKVPHSIRSRFLLLSALTVGLALALTTVLLVSLFSSNIRKRIDAELTSHINTLVGALDFAPDGALLRPKGPVDQRFGEPYGGLYWQIVDQTRGGLLRSPSLWDTRLELPDDGASDGAIHHYTLPGPDGTTLIVQERTVMLKAPDGPRKITIAAAVDAATLEEARAGFRADILPAIAALGLFLIGASIAQLTVGLRPLSSLGEGIDRIRERRDSRLTGRFPAEFESTVTALNQLIDTQAAMVEKARTRAADLAHGLRTPLTVLSNDALTLRDKGETALADELDELAATMQAHVERELALARIAARPDLRRGDSVIAPLVERLLRTLKRSPAGEALTFTVRGDAAAKVPVDPGDFHDLVGNLLENAVKWARSHVALSWWAEGETLHLDIIDDGPGVPADALPNLSRRGWRLDNSVPGSGLGLSIVREIADVYGIALVFANGTDPAGFSARLTFRTKPAGGFTA